MRIEHDWTRNLRREQLRSDKGQNKQAATNSFCEEIEATTGDKVGMACSIFEVLANLEIFWTYFKVLRIFKDHVNLM